VSWGSASHRCVHLAHEPLADPADVPRRHGAVAPGAQRAFKRAILPSTAGAFTSRARGAIFFGTVERLADAI